MHHSALRTGIVTAFVAVLAGCTEKITEVTVIQDCAPGAPNGKCEPGSQCVDGACVDSSTLCSPTNLSGSCASGTTCFSGGCVVTSSLCSTSNPTGPCGTGNSCVNGSCVALSTLCSTSNTTGTCPSGQVCVDGLCARTGGTGGGSGSTGGGSGGTGGGSGSTGGGSGSTGGGSGTIDPCTENIYTAQPTIGVRSRAKLTVAGLEFKDNNGNGTLDLYEDWRKPELCRARDLVSKMTVPEKIGLMSEGATIGSGTTDGTISTGTENNIKNLKLRQALIRLGTLSAAQIAAYLNNVQEMCEAQPHGIPFVVTADPVHGFGLTTNATTGAQTLSASTVVSPWPYPMGLGAANDVSLTKLYGDTVRREFKAMGFRWQLGPMADLATEPRWARVQNTFGENALAVGTHTRACIEGFQGSTNGDLKTGIAATIKHFPGAGPNEDGMDSHSRVGRFNVFPGNYFLYHQEPYKIALTARPAALMPCYSIFKGQLDWSPEQTGAALSHGLITEYLKEQLGFSGMVTGDWGSVGGTSWGVDALTPQQRAALFLRAGSHQFGNDSVTIMQQAFDMGLVTEAELDVAATKILEMSFKLGIFENPYTDTAASAMEARSATNLGNGLIAQKKAIVILRNREHTNLTNGAKYLPIDGARKQNDGGIIDDVNGNGSVEVYYDGVNEGLSGSDIYDPSLSAYNYTSTAGTLADGGAVIPVVSVATPQLADIAVLRISARKGTYFGLDNGVPLSWDAPFPGTQADTNLPSAVKEAQKVIDLFRIRDGYTDFNGNVVPAANPRLKIVLVVHFDRPGIVKPFLNGLVNINPTGVSADGGISGYPLVSNDSNIRTDGLGGVDALLGEFGAFDRAVLDVLFNKNVPTTPANYVYGGTSRMPIEIPSTDTAVNNQFEDVPADSAAPSFNQGAGSTY